MGRFENILLRDRPHRKREIMDTEKQPNKNKGTNKGWSNLKPIKKGEIRNPKGRPKKGSAIADILNAIGDTEKDDTTRREIILSKAYDMAEQGSFVHLQFIADRTEGKAVERILKQKVNDIIEIL